MAWPDFTREALESGLVAGIDEAGRGPWAGPVVAAAVILDKACLPLGVNDSKQMTRAKREEVYAVIYATASVGVGICNVEEIDSYNILGASLLAMKRAYHALPVTPCKALIDGNRLPDLPCPMEAIVGGDGLCLCIAAASIIAKVTRDRIMVELAVAFPAYGWERNAGYGTKAHQEGLATHGITPHHRRSFAPIRTLIQRRSA